jgi:hypothetical protein
MNRLPCRPPSGTLGCKSAVAFEDCGMAVEILGRMAAIGAGGGGRRGNSSVRKFAKKAAAAGVGPLPLTSFSALTSIRVRDNSSLLRLVFPKSAAVVPTAAIRSKRARLDQKARTFCRSGFRMGLRVRTQDVRTSSSTRSLVKQVKSSQVKSRQHFRWIARVSISNNVNALQSPMAVRTVSRSEHVRVGVL